MLENRSCYDWLELSTRGTFPTSNPEKRGKAACYKPPRNPRHLKPQESMGKSSLGHFFRLLFLHSISTDFCACLSCLQWNLCLENIRKMDLQLCKSFRKIDRTCAHWQIGRVSMLLAQSGLLHIFKMPRSRSKPKNTLPRCLGKYLWDIPAASSWAPYPGYGVELALCEAWHAPLLPPCQGLRNGLSTAFTRVVLWEWE